VCFGTESPITRYAPSDRTMVNIVLLAASCTLQLCHLQTPSMRRPVGVKTVLFFLSVDPNLFTEPPLSPSFHPQSFAERFSLAARWASSIQ
jgi:hypothetical protein